MDILDMIDLIQKRPGMYIGSNSITALFHYLNGYQAAEWRNGLCRKGELFPLPFRYIYVQSIDIGPVVELVKTEEYFYVIL